MNPITKATGVLCAIVAVAVFSIESSAAGSATEMAALQAVDQDWVKAYNAGNADAVASLYDEQAVLLPPGSGAVNGRAGRVKDLTLGENIACRMHRGEYRLVLLFRTAREVMHDCISHIVLQSTERARLVRAGGASTLRCTCDPDNSRRILHRGRQQLGRDFLNVRSGDDRTAGQGRKRSLTTDC